MCTYRRKAEYLRIAGRFMLDLGWNGSPESITMETDRLRCELLALKGIGLETCDGILLYVTERPVFVVDAYTKRILSRHGICRDKATYQEIQTLFHSSLDSDVNIYKEYHAFIVECAKQYCRPNPLCADCPLNERGVVYDCSKQWNSNCQEKTV